MCLMYVIYKTLGDTLRMIVVGAFLELWLGIEGKHVAFLELWLEMAYFEL